METDIASSGLASTEIDPTLGSITDGPTTGEPPADEPMNPASTRDRARAIALELFATQGYDGTSMREIAEQLGVTKAALYYHFAGKEDIVRSVVDHYLGRLDEVILFANGDPKPSPAEVLARWTDVMRSTGLPLMRFMQANQHIVEHLHFDKGSLRERMMPLFAALEGDDHSLQARLRARIAVHMIHAAGFLGTDLGADDNEIADATLQIATDLIAD